MKTVIYYLSATGNSLYAARFLQASLEGAELRSIPEALADGRLAVEADVVGFVFPLHYMGLPLQVEDFMERLSMAGNPYVFAVATCGVPYLGTPFLDAEEILRRKTRLSSSPPRGRRSLSCRPVPQAPPPPRHRRWKRHRP